MKKATCHIITHCLALLLLSCSYSKKFTATYYKENQETLQAIRKNFRQLYDTRPFSLELKDNTVKRIGLEINTDTIKYIYNFRLDERFFIDTLDKYQLDIKNMSQLISQMQLAHCTWITNLDYYENGARKELLFVSVRHKKLDAFLQPEKYFTLAFFSAPQPFDKKQRLLDKADKKTLRKINGEVFRRVNDRVFYALMDHYR